MPGRGPAPKAQRRNQADVPIRGEYVAVPGSGWQHGDIPPCPSGMLKPTRDAWDTWMRAWCAAHWTPSDLPGLRKVIQLYDQTERGEFVRSAELRMAMDNYGITPKGQQDRRWQPPKGIEQPTEEPAPQPGSRFAHLRAVG
jgi:hypothetical protein